MLRNIVHQCKVYMSLVQHCVHVSSVFFELYCFRVTMCIHCHQEIKALDGKKAFPHSHCVMLICRFSLFLPFGLAKLWGSELKRLSLPYNYSKCYRSIHTTIVC